MKLYQDLQYIGKDKRLDLFNNGIWHCTNFATEYSTNEMKFCVQQPYYKNREFIGYTGLDTYVLTEDELIQNFKIIKEDGTLEDIKLCKDSEKLYQMLRELVNSKYDK